MTRAQSLLLVVCSLIADRGTEPAIVSIRHPSSVLISSPLSFDLFYGTLAQYTIDEGVEIWQACCDDGQMLRELHTECGAPEIICEIFRPGVPIVHDEMGGEGNDHAGGGRISVLLCDI